MNIYLNRKPPKAAPAAAIYQSTVTYPVGQQPELLDGQVGGTLDQGTHMTVTLSVTSGHLKTHENFLTGRISHASLLNNLRLTSSKNDLTGKFHYGLSTPERVLDQDIWREYTKHDSTRSPLPKPAFHSRTSVTSSSSGCRGPKVHYPKPAMRRVRITSGSCSSSGKRPKLKSLTRYIYVGTPSLK